MRHQKGMNQAPEIICIGAVHWDVIGHATGPMLPGADVPGRITRQPGGVALNIALALARQRVAVALLGAVGRDRLGDALVAEITARGVDPRYLFRPEDLPTDSYMAIEDSSGLIAAIADSHTMEAAGLRLLESLSDGLLGAADTPFRGMIALDGGLTEVQLDTLVSAPTLAQADLRVVPASSGKALRLAPFFRRAGTCFYVNLEEAGLLCGEAFADSPSAALGMLARGAGRVLVTDSARAVTDADAKGLIIRTPRRVQAQRVTGAGDTFMAAHMAAELRGASRSDALECALEVAAAHVASAPAR